MAYQVIHCSSVISCDGLWFLSRTPEVHLISIYHYFINICFPQTDSTREKLSEIKELSLWFSHLGLRNCIMLKRRLLWLSENRAFCARGSCTYTGALWDDQEMNCVWIRLTQTKLPANLYGDGTTWPSATAAVRVCRYFRDEQDVKWCLYGWTEGTMNLCVCNMLLIREIRGPLLSDCIQPVLWRLVP